MHWARSAVLLFAASVASQNNTAPCKRCEDVAHGFASLNGGTTGGKGGRVVVATTHKQLVDYAKEDGPLIIRVSGTLQSEPRGFEIPIASNKTIIGVGAHSGIVGGGFAIKGTRNIILRNLQISDTRIPEDWPGKTEDWDGIQVDTGTNIWLDHIKFARMNDGLIDLRRDSTYVTVSSCILSEHNKAFGIGWTQNVTAKVTINDCFFNSTSTRNPSADNLEMCHIYNNYYRNVTSYGVYSRGRTNLLLEHTYFENTHDPVVVGANATIKSTWVTFKGTTGAQMLNQNPEKVFKASDYYNYTLRDIYDIPNDIPYFGGPQQDIGS